MARESHELEQDFIDSAKDKTGRAVGEWMTVIADTGLDKSKVITDFLKQEHKLNHLQASILTGIFLNNGEPVHDYDKMFASLFEGKDASTALYKAVENLVKKRLPEDVVCVPTKAYVSIEGKRVFACAKINTTNVRVGLDLGDEPFDAYVVPAKSLGAMPNIGHMVEVTDIAQVDDKLGDYLLKAYTRRHG